MISSQSPPQREGLNNGSGDNDGVSNIRDHQSTLSAPSATSKKREEKPWSDTEMPSKLQLIICTALLPAIIMCFQSNEVSDMINTVHSKIW